METKYFTKDGWFKREYLWSLREEIILGSIYVRDYRNSFGIDEHKVCDFFTSYWDSYCQDLANEDGLYEEAKERYIKSLEEDDVYNEHYVWEEFSELFHQRYDNEHALKSWYDCFCEECPLPMEEEPEEEEPDNWDEHDYCAR